MSDDPGEPTSEKHPNLKTPWQPGQSGNPAGRPRGARQKIGEDFLNDLHGHWQEHGKDAIDRMCAKHPAEYVKVVAALLPKQIEIKETPFDGISDEQLAALIAAAKSALGIAEEQSQTLQ